MTVKDFIEKIRPLTAINPDTELFLQDDHTKRFDISFIMIDDKSVEINLK